MAQSRVRSEADELPRNAIFEVLSCQRRRHALHFLAQQDETVSLRAVSEQVAAWEQGVDTSDISWAQRKNVYTALRQLHLPRMDDMGIVEFDQERGEVLLGNDIEDLELHLDLVPENDVPWNKYYLGLSVFCGWLLMLAEVGLVPFSDIDTAVWATIFVLMFGVSAVSHTYHDRQMRLGSEGPPPGYEYERRDSD